MILEVIFQIFISLLIIVSIQYIYCFFRDNLTTPIIKDMINKPKNTYKEVYDKINDSVQKKINQNKSKDELKNYMKTLINKK